MENIWIITVVIFLIVLFFYWKISKDYFKKEVVSNGMWTNWGTQAFYWQGAIFVSIGITMLILFFLKWATILA